MILSLDVGTIDSAYSLIRKSDYKPIEFGIVSNEELIDITKSKKYDKLVYEEFQNYGMPIGKTTIESITWNGRFIQIGKDRKVEVIPIYRKDVKINLCQTMKAKDSNIRQALIDRFGEVGIKKKQGWFYGFKKDVWSSYAIGITYLDLKNTK